ncbi:hypothetical protein NA56DRAFT_596098, partial [Hyaloscypha hepaticicola]
MNLQSNPEPPPQRILSPSSSRSCASSFRDGFSRYRWVLYFLVGMIVLIMALSLLFIAHQYYIGFGGQGWLKGRDERQEQHEIYANHLFLPLRKQEVWTAGSQRRSPQNDVPYYACGDQQNSCQTYNQPNICCPPWSICYEASFTLSGIFCCNASVSQFECQASESHPPKCLASLVECPAAAGGGCCPKDDVCSPNGCI